MIKRNVVVNNKKHAHPAGHLCESDGPSTVVAVNHLQESEGPMGTSAVGLWKSYRRVTSLAIVIGHGLYGWRQEAGQLSQKILAHCLYKIFFFFFLLPRRIFGHSFFAPESWLNSLCEIRDPTEGFGKRDRSTLATVCGPLTTGRDGRDSWELRHSK